MEERKNEVSKLTKILIHKAHGGRKKDSKFWKDNIELEKKDINEESDKTKRIRKKNLSNPIYGHIFRFCGVILIVAFWTSIYLDNNERKKEKINEVSKIQLYDYSPKKILPTQSYQQKRNHFSNKTKPGKAIATKPFSSLESSISSNSIIERTSLTGKVFSWIDENGSRHYSNTNFPRNNPTLKVQNEINKQSSVTKISVRNGQIFIPVSFKNNGNWITLNMVLDTGCSHTNVSYKDLGRLDVTYTKKITSRIADGSKNYGMLTKVDMIRVGPNREYNFHITGSKVAGSQNRGLLGLDFLKKHPFKIDFDNEFVVWNQ